MKLFRSLFASLALGWLCSLGWAQPAGLPGVDLGIQPTVTPEMGDVGGKFFGRAPDPAKTRHYYIAAEPELWDYAPSGRDEVCGNPLPPPVVAQRLNSKLRYVQYTDETFAAKVIAPPSLGILGPMLRGVVGEYLVVTFLNRTGQPLSMHPHGVKYDKDSEGAYYRPGPGKGSAVGPGATFTYVWFLDEASGPLPDEPSSKAWLYHSHVTGDEEINLGLVGAIIVTDPARARPDGTPADIDREFATLFMIFDESGLGAEVKEAAEYASLPGGPPAPKTFSQVQELMEQGSRFAINGTIFGNLKGLEMNEGERTRWYLFGLGSEQDFHTAHWHGVRVVESRRRTDVVELLPASMKVADFVADNPGTWLFHCHVAEHMTEGMFAALTVYPRDAVGVDRAPEFAFLGMKAAKQSLLLTRTELTAATLRLEGSVTVFEAFSVFNQPVRVEVAGKSIAFQPDHQGMARSAAGTLRIENADAFGVVRGGLMKFEVQLTGSDWLVALDNKDPATRGAPEGSRSVSAPVVLNIGGAQHKATAQLVYKAP